MRKTVAGARPSSDYIKRNDTTLKGYGKSLSTTWRWCALPLKGLMCYNMHS